MGGELFTSGLWNRLVGEMEAIANLRPCEIRWLEIQILR